MDNLSIRISDYVKRVRLEKKLSVTDVVKNCKLSRSYINMIESGRNPKTNKPIGLTLDAIEELCKGLGVSKKEFLIRVGFVDSLDAEPLLNYRLLLEEIMAYKSSANGVDFDKLPFEEREKLFTDIDEYISFRIHKLVKDDY